jgi:Spy/CpxP family protein refolding chaperone
VLTPEQWQKFQQLRNEMRGRRGSRGGPPGQS